MEDDRLLDEVRVASCDKKWPPYPPLTQPEVMMLQPQKDDSPQWLLWLHPEYVKPLTLSPVALAATLRNGFRLEKSLSVRLEINDLQNNSDFGSRPVCSHCRPPLWPPSLCDGRTHHPSCNHFVRRRIYIELGQSREAKVPLRKREGSKGAWIMVSE